ncbi:hypothetical protein ACFV0H_28405 [Streptomyces erythrochromogenes]|uniref:hypothetical protein n=1 Tax=Streptomyces erythrochromogenes TaxID=285574 RepID=UPI00368D34F9
MHKIELTSKVWYLLEGTGVMQGEESPEIKAEMDALKRNKRGVRGSVSLDTVGWMLDTLEAMGEGEDKAENQAIRAALAKLDAIYRNNGGTVTTLGELRQAEEASAVADAAQAPEPVDQEQEQDQEQEPEASWTHGELRALPSEWRMRDDAFFLFGGKGGNRSAEPSQSTLATVGYVGSGKYDIREASTGAVLHVGTLQSLIWWAPVPPVGGGATDCDPAEIQDVSSLGYGQPVYHEHTRVLVGYLRPGAFTPIRDIQDHLHE